MNGLFPLYQKGVFEYPAAMAIAVFLGIGFGFMLERGGFGRATILVSQFYNDDMRVLKVMFSAIVTSAVGLALLGGLGWVDLSAIMIFDTFLWPQVVGGILLGVGFIVSGHCPGTAAVASVSGNMDGLVTLVGIMAGSLVFGFAYPLVEGFYESSAMGRQHLPELLGTSWGVMAAAVTVLAVGLFLAGEWVERKLAARKGVEPPKSDPVLRNKLFAGLGVAAAAALVVSFVGRTAPVTPEPAPLALVSADDLADRMVQDPTGLFVVDLRDPGACAARRLPGALCLPAEGDLGRFFADLPATRTVVVYGAAGQAVPAEARRFTGRLLALDGGFAAFHGRYLTRPVLNAAASASERADWTKRNALYAHFTGSAAAKAPPAPPRKVITRAVKKGGGC
ncbi:MAG: YeeE/YedE family protein [Myxococcales bacterium]|nr:YeeE/YedE family protein [Myxococcales bacterium]